MSVSSICVLGLGYIGLPTSAMFASSGLNVVGVDVREEVVKTINRGEIHIEEPGLEELVRRAVQSGKLSARTAPVSSDAFIIAVPTPVNEADHSADLGAVSSAARAIREVLKRGDLVILESTSPPGTTLNVVRPILEESGLVAGRDFKLAYSPERVLPGRIMIELIENDRVVGGIDPASAEAGKELYAAFVQGDIMTTNCTTAEMVKLMENTFRDVNIALANEFGMIAERLDVNVWEAIKIANRHPRVNILRPGPGVGGHCIAVDPWFFVGVAPEEAKIIHMARTVNDSMPGRVVEMVRKAIGSTGRVACLGVSFKADIDDIRESPAMDVVRRLDQAGYSVSAFDPHVFSLGRLDHLRATSFQEVSKNADCIVVLVDHTEFKGMTPQDFPDMKQRIIVDTRGIVDMDEWAERGFNVKLIGAGHAADPTHLLA